MTPLPTWPTRTVGMLATTGPDGLHVIPVSAPLRAGEDQILLSLHRTRGSLARLRERPDVALLVLAGDDVAFTARGRATVVEEPMDVAPEYAAVRIDVDGGRRPSVAGVRRGCGRRPALDRRIRAEGARRARRRAQRPFRRLNAFRHRQMGVCW